MKNDKFDKIFGILLVGFGIVLITISIISYTVKIAKEKSYDDGQKQGYSQGYSEGYTNGAIYIIDKVIKLLNEQKDKKPI